MHDTSPELDGGAEIVYDLVSVIQHHGKSANGGHYSAICRLGAEGEPPDATYILYKKASVLFPLLEPFLCLQLILGPFCC